MEDRLIGHNFLSRDIPANFGLIWFSCFRWEYVHVIFMKICLICTIDINRLEEKCHRKPRNICYTTHNNVAAVKIKEISIFIKTACHPEWMAVLSDQPMIIPARFGLICFSGFRGEDLRKYMTYHRHTPSDCKSLRGLWTDELKQRYTSTENTFVNNKHRWTCRVLAADCFMCW